MIKYKSISEIPDLVAKATNIAVEDGFGNSSSIETGRLLYTISAMIKEGTVAEIGTGCGVGASWIISAINSNVKFISIDNDYQKVNICSNLFKEFSNVNIVNGDWKDILPYGPFELLFADGGKAKEQGPDQLFNALEIGGMIIIDDLTPEDKWPEEWKGKPDLVREYWLNHPKLAATEILVHPNSSVIVATRLKV